MIRLRTDLFVKLDNIIQARQVGEATMRVLVYDPEVTEHYYIDFEGTPNEFARLISNG